MPQVCLPSSLPLALELRAFPLSQLHQPYFCEGFFEITAFRRVVIRIKQVCMFKHTYFRA
jgi:hypothetical protein